MRLMESWQMLEMDELLGDHERSLVILGHSEYRLEGEEWGDEW